MAPKLSVREISFAERLVRFRRPFRFGAITVEEAPQVFVRAVIDVAGHGRAVGAAAELMVPKWFDKDPALTAAQTVDELRRSLAIARETYLSAGKETAFGLHAAAFAPAISACAAEEMPALAAQFGAAEIDKALLDALLRALGLDVFVGWQQNVCGIDPRLTPDLAQEEIDAFLASRQPLARVAVRHTVGLTDPLAALKSEIRQTGCRYFKIKLGGDADADRARLVEISALLAERAPNYRATVDGNEQYADAGSLAALLEALDEPPLQAFAQRLLYIEQPFSREMTLREPLGERAKRFAFMIDEADDSYDAFPTAHALGYRAVSSKCCKGIYRALLNGVRAQKWSREGGATFVAAEDLTCQAGLAVQQDTSLAAFLGITHVERNGHHYVDGFGDAPKAEAQAFLNAHPDLYEDRGGGIRLAIRNGDIALGSLTVPGFASGVDPAAALPSAAKPG